MSYYLYYLDCHDKNLNINLNHFDYFSKLILLYYIMVKITKNDILYYFKNYKKLPIRWDEKKRKKKAILVKN